MNILPYLAVFFKCCIYGSTIYFTGNLTKSLDVLDVLALRFLLSFVLMFILKKIGVLKIKIGVRDFFVKNERTPYLKNILLAALFEPVLYMLFETLGISMTTGVTTAVILSLSPIVTCILEELVVKEKSSILQKIFLGAGIFGVIFIAVNTNTSDGTNSPVGIVCLLLAITVSGMFAVFSKRSSKKFSSLEITYVSCILGTVAFNFINVVRHLIAGDIFSYFDPYFNIHNLIGFGFLSVFASIVAVYLSNYSLSKIQMSSSAAFGGVSTVVTVLIDVILNGAILYNYHYIGFIFILARMIGVSVISIRRDKIKKKNRSINSATV